MPFQLRGLLAGDADEEAKRREADWGARRLRSAGREAERKAVRYMTAGPGVEGSRSKERRRRNVSDEVNTYWSAATAHLNSKFLCRHRPRRSLEVFSRGLSMGASASLNPTSIPIGQLRDPRPWKGTGSGIDCRLAGFNERIRAGQAILPEAEIGVTRRRGAWHNLVDFDNKNANACFLARVRDKTTI